MSASMNKVILVGNVTRNPELRHATSGTAVCDLGIAMNDTYTKDGEKIENTTFVEVTIWNRDAENVATYIKTGAPILIEARLKNEKWDDKETGKPRSKLALVATRVQFLGSKNDGQSGQ